MISTPSSFPWGIHVRFVHQPSEIFGVPSSNTLRCGRKVLCPLRLVGSREGCSVGACHDDGLPSSVCVGLLHDRRSVGSNDTADGHEEAVIKSSESACGLFPPPPEVEAYPNVAPDAPMNWPSVLIIPFGPAPYLNMLTVPVEKSILGSGSTGRIDHAHTVDEANDDTNSCKVLLDLSLSRAAGLIWSVEHTAAHHGTHLRCSILATQLVRIVSKVGELYPCPGSRGQLAGYG